jgi:hypothetical protein
VGLALFWEPAETLCSEEYDDDMVVPERVAAVGMLTKGLKKTLEAVRGTHSVQLIEYCRQL